MIGSIISIVLLIAFFVAIALSVSLLWVKVLCWIIVAAIVVALLFCWWINSTWGEKL